MLRLVETLSFPHPPFGHLLPPKVVGEGSSQFAFSRRFWWEKVAEGRMRDYAPAPKILPRVSLTFTILRHGWVWLVNG
jgi:hypothetical protein